MGTVFLISGCLPSLRTRRSEQEKHRRRDLLYALKSRREQMLHSLKRAQQQDRCV